MSNSNGLSGTATGVAPTIVPREETQAKLDIRSRASVQIKPGDFYTVGDRLEEMAARQGDRPFLLYGDQTFSYAEVDKQANRYANALRKLGVVKGDTVAMAIENRPDFFFAWFGIVKLGASVAFINTQISGRPLAHALAATEARLLLLGEECLVNFASGGIPDGMRCYRVKDAEKPANPALLASAPPDISAALSVASCVAPDRSLRAGVTAETTMLLIFTSGTTGLPKAAKYSHMRWMSSGDVMEVTLGATPDDVFYCCLPLYHGAAATSVTSTALKSGAAVAFRRKFSTREFWPDVRRYGVTICQYIGEICRYLLNQDPSDQDRQHRLRSMLGAGLSAEVWQRWIDRFGPMQVFEGWGSTEANASLINVDNYLGSCGRVPFWEKTNLRLVRYDIEADAHVRDANGRFVQCLPGEVGEAIGMIFNHPEIGAGRFEGYTSREATEKKILRNVFQDGDAYWSSGDLLRYDENGYFYFVDRIGDTFRWKSENVSTQEVADAMGDLRGVESINIYGVRVPEHEGRAGMAAVVMQEGREFDPKAFFAQAEARLPRYAAPLFVRVCQAADMTSTFKLRKVDLQRQGYDPEAFADPLLVRDEAARSYVPYSEAALQQAGIPAYRDAD